MRDWPDLDEPEGSSFMLYLEFWAIAALMMLGFGMAFGPPVIRFIRGMM